jgi:hypothetical protein
MTPRWSGYLRRLLRPEERQWLDAAFAELPHIDENQRARWRAGITTYIARGCLERLAAATAATSALVIAAFGIGLLDLNIEPTSVSLLLILAAAATGGYVFHRSWWLPGLVIGSSISFTAGMVLLFDLHPPGRPVETSVSAIIALLVLTLPAVAASRCGAGLRHRRPAPPVAGPDF